MAHRVPEGHGLRRLFRSAVDSAFRQKRELYSPRVASHLVDELLCDFVHVDRIYRLQDAAGGPIEDIQQMLPLTQEKEGPERRLEVDRYIGDFALFMASFFPAILRNRRWESAQPMVSRVRGILVSFSQPLDYYRAEGRNAYTRAAETARLFDPDSGPTYSQLAERFEGYQDLLGDVKQYLWKLPEVHDEGLADA